jgi:hypothetical protein
MRERWAPLLLVAFVLSLSTPFTGVEFHAWFYGVWPHRDPEHGILAVPGTQEPAAGYPHAANSTNSGATPC